MKATASLLWFLGDTIPPGIHKTDQSEHLSDRNFNPRSSELEGQLSMNRLAEMIDSHCTVHGHASKLNNLSTTFRVMISRQLFQPCSD